MQQRKCCKVTAIDLRALVTKNRTSSVRQKMGTMGQAAERKATPEAHEEDVASLFDHSESVPRIDNLLGTM